MYRLIFILSTLLILFTACTNESKTSSDIDYHQLKKMVTDILQTEDGQKAVAEVLKTDKMKHTIVMDADEMKQTITEILSSEDQAKEMWEKLFSDADFAKTYAKSIASEQKKLLLSLMDDATFQEKLIGIIDNPEVTEQMITALKSQKFRSHLEENIQQAVNSPLFQTKITESLLKAAEKTQDEKEKGKEEEGKEEEKGSE